MRLTWLIKESLIRYLEGLPDLEVELEGVTRRDDGGFVFPASPGHGGDGEHVLRFSGSVRFTGHGGLLDLRVAEPALTRRGEGWILTIADEPCPLAFATIARFAREPGGVRGTGVHLTEEGSDLFFGPYTGGTPFADLLIERAPEETAEFLTG